MNLRHFNLAWDDPQNNRVKGIPDKCLTCEIFKNKKEQFLRNEDSIFDAQLELEHFLSECRKNCNLS